MAPSKPPSRPLALIPGGRSVTGDSLAALEDDDLMRLVSQDHRGAFREIVRRHERGLRAFCGHSLGAGALADDVVQEVFLDLWRGRARYVAEGKLAAFVYAVARHRCEDARRRDRRHGGGAATGMGPRQPAALQLSRPTEQEPTTSPEDLLAQVLRAERLARLDAALGATSPKLREAVLLRFSAGLSYPEIARVTGRSEVTVRSRVFLAIRKLRDLLATERGDA